MGEDLAADFGEGGLHGVDGGPCEDELAYLALCPQDLLGSVVYQRAGTRLRDAGTVHLRLLLALHRRAETLSSLPAARWARFRSGPDGMRTLAPCA